MDSISGDLIARAAKGDRYAIEDLYNSTYTNVYHTVKSVIRDEDAVLDIVQDSYIKAFQSLDQLDRPESFRPWIKRIALNRAKDHLKRKKPLLFSEMAAEDGTEPDFRDEQPDHLPEEILDWQETTRLIGEILGTLSEEQRMVIGMFYYEEMSVREIAETLGCSENTVKSRLNYGRKKIEVQVKELEKKGTKLYSLAPLPFLVWLLRSEAQAAALPSSAILETVAAECASAATGTAAKTAVSAGIKGLAAKLTAGILSLTVLGGAAAAAITHFDSNAKRDRIYKPVLDNYLELSELDAYTYVQTADQYYGASCMNIAYILWRGLDLHYAYRDIDGNGTDELLIAREDGLVLDVLTTDGEQAIPLFDHYRSDIIRINFMEDGTLVLDTMPANFESAGEITWSLLKIGEDGHTLEVLEDHTPTVRELVDPHDFLDPSEFDWEVLTELDPVPHPEETDHNVMDFTPDFIP